MNGAMLAMSAYLGLLILWGSVVPGAALSAFLSESQYVRGRSKLLDKFGQQSAALSVKSLALLLLLLCPWVLYSLLYGRVPHWLLEAVSGQGVLGLAVLPLLSGLIGVVLYSGAWQALHYRKGLHRLLGAVSLLGILGGIYAVINAQLGQDGQLASQGLAGWRAVWFPAGHPVWPLWSAAVLNAVASAGAAKMIYLILRREKDDFGRDYYRFALARAAKWAPVLLALPPLGAGWIALSSPAAFSTRILILLAAAAAVAIAAAALCLPVIRSRHPLRLKANAAGVLLLTWVLDVILVLFVSPGAWPA